MANSPENLLQINASEFQSVANSAIPEVDIVMGMLKSIFEIITLA